LTNDAGAIGFASFLAPFVGCAAAAHYLLGWETMPSWLAGVAMSTTSVAVVYAVMLEYGFNATNYGKTVLAACFVTDLGTVVALGLIFAPFTIRTLIFLGVGIVVFVILPWLTPRFFRLYGNRPSELETKFLLLSLLGMGALASWADSEAVLPAYLIGMVLAGTVGKDHALVRRLRTLTFGLLTPFYFIRAGSFVSVPALVAAPAAFVLFLIVKIGTKIVGVYPVTKLFKAPNKEAMYTTLLMSTGLTFGTISSLFEQMRDELDAAFTKSITTDIENVFLIRPGPHIRHDVAHGLLHDGAPYSPDAFYACWLIFRLCFLPLFPHLEQLRGVIQDGGLGLQEELD